jgi:hypothetical protein
VDNHGHDTRGTGTAKDQDILSLKGIYSHFLSLYLYIPHMIFVTNSHVYMQNWALGMMHSMLHCISYFWEEAFDSSTSLGGNLIHQHDTEDKI